MFLTRGQQRERPATDYERWLNNDTPDQDSIPQFEPVTEHGVVMHRHGQRPTTVPYAGVDIINGFDQYDPSNVPPPNYHDVSRRPRVPDIITFYGALLVLLFLVKYFVQTLLRQLRRGREEPDRPSATRRSNQVPSIVVSDSELKKG
ncbi:hypothetical protein ASPCAL10489 [Aspergillus calidoustus]|uniref:Uncharacterized protein n=1 Tax=Aspergillus calidoustus TaxID=454130 RepID=A0A0U5G602_ASPCI|nr:hypothetical protein ASPCAL10489 [Aspergillus calidoustus]